MAQEKTRPVSINTNMTTNKTFNNFFAKCRGSNNTKSHDNIFQENIYGGLDIQKQLEAQRNEIHYLRQLSSELMQKQKKPVNINELIKKKAYVSYYTQFYNESKGGRNHGLDKTSQGQDSSHVRQGSFDKIFNNEHINKIDYQSEGISGITTDCAAKTEETRRKRNKQNQIQKLLSTHKVLLNEKQSENFTQSQITNTNFSIGTQQKK